MDMTSNKPYLVRAFYDWIIDNDCTPYVLVSVLTDQVRVPMVHVVDGQIVLNIAPRAVTAFNLDNTAISFNARFGGIATDIYVPIESVLGIYAHENNEGMVFQQLPIDEGAKPSGADNSDSSDPEPKPPGSGGPRLRVVK